MGFAAWFKLWLNHSVTMGNLPSLESYFFFHFFSAFLMSFYYVAGIPGNRIRRVTKIDKILTSRELTFQGREIDNKQVSK